MIKKRTLITVIIVGLTLVLVTAAVCFNMNALEAITVETVWEKFTEAGLPVAAVGFFFWLLKRSMDKRDAEAHEAILKREAERIKREAEVQAAIAAREVERTKREAILEEEKKQEAAVLQLRLEERQKEIEAREEIKLSLAIKQTAGILAAITLGVATAEALRDQRCNGNVSNALIRGTDAKTDIEKFLLQRGLQNVEEDLK